MADQTSNNLANAIVELKKKKNAVILAHYYQPPEIQDIADFLGDSLALAQAAQTTKAQIILFAGVSFMAETAKILCPDRKVLLPDESAGCSLSDECPAEQFESFINRYPNRYVISYVNSSAAVKALSDILCTSSNAEQIVRNAPKDKTVIFGPDRNLGRYLAQLTKRELVVWDGFCIVHENFDHKGLLLLKDAHPHAKVLAHPECPKEILDEADVIGSTQALLNFTHSSAFEEFIVVTEPGILHQMKKLSPLKNFYPAPAKDGLPCSECPHMKKNSLEKLYNCLVNEKPEIILSTELISKAKAPLERMLSFSSNSRK